MIVKLFSLYEFSFLTAQKIYITKCNNVFKGHFLVIVQNFALYNLFEYLMIMVKKIAALSIVLTMNSTTMLIKQIVFDLYIYIYTKKLLKRHQRI